MPENKNQNNFITPEKFARQQMEYMESPRGKLLIAGCRAGDYMAKQVVDYYRRFLKNAGSRDDILFLDKIDRQFSDSETCVRLDKHVSGYDVFLIQCLYNPAVNRTIDENYMAFIIAARTLREHGAKHVTAVLPYLAYARQDKPTKFTREPTTAKLMADLSVTAGIDRLITWHPHSTQLHGFYGELPLNLLDPQTLFLNEFQQFEGRDDVVVVSPDAGASKLITHFGRAMNINSAIASKVRPKPEEVVTTEIIGNFENKNTAIVLDDIVSSAGTINSVIKKLVHEKGIRDVYLGISHNLCSDKAYEHLVELYDNGYLKKMIITDSIPQTEKFYSLPFIKILNLGEVLVNTVNRIHYNRSVSEIIIED